MAGVGRRHRLEFYRRAVQHPEAEVRFLLEAYGHYRGSYPTRLREDFAGTAAVAAAWAGFADHHQAVAVESDGPTLRWARRQAGARRVTFVQGDVLAVRGPGADVVAALNFSVCEWQDRRSLLTYLRHARRCLRQGGMLVVDLFGGPGAMAVGTQTRRVRCDDGVRFDYVWEQRSYDHVTGRIDCRIHFRFRVAGQGGRGVRTLRDAFRYDWRLWTPVEMIEAMTEAGFAAAEVWCDRVDPATGQSDGHFQPRTHMPARHDWVAYVVALR